MHPLIRLRWAVPAGLVAGLLVWLAFEPVAFSLAAVLGVALMTFAVWRASVGRGLLVGFIAGMAFYVPLIAWMQVIGSDAWVVLSAACAGYMALLGAGTALVTRLPGAPVWVGALWVAQEAARSRFPLGGFPWGDLSFSQTGTGYVNYAPVAGAPMVTFAIALTGAALVSTLVAVLRRQLRPALTWAGVVVVLALVPLAVHLPTTGDTVGGADSSVVAVIQGGTPQTGMGGADVREVVLRNHLRETLDLAAAIDAGRAPQPAVVVWPENGTDIDPLHNPAVGQAITAAARAVGAPILVGAVIATDNPEEAANVGIVWDPVAGPHDTYVKMHPVPFGEYVPFRSLLAKVIGRFDRVPRDYIGGAEPGNLVIGGVPIGDIICFEVAYRGIVDSVVGGGARMLTVQTNNATYGGTVQPEQQLTITRLRAIENGRSVAVAATSGVSALIGPDGTVLQSIAEGETGWLVQSVVLRGSRTPGSLVGAPLELVVSLVGVAALVVAGVTTRRRRTAPPDVAAAGPSPTVER